MRIRDDASSGQVARFIPRLMMDFIGAGLTCIAGTLANVAFDGGPPAGRWSLVGVKLLVAYAAACVVVLVLFQDGIGHPFQPGIGINGKGGGLGLSAGATGDDLDCFLGHAGRLEVYGADGYGLGAGSLGSRGVGWFRFGHRILRLRPFRRVRFEG